MRLLTKKFGIFSVNGMKLYQYKEEWKEKEKIKWL